MEIVFAIRKYENDLANIGSNIANIGQYIANTLANMANNSHNRIFFLQFAHHCGMMKSNCEVKNVLPEELIELAGRVRRQRAEGQTLEVKAAHGGCPRLYDTLSSFSNQAEGGTILFGLDENAGFALVGIYDAQNLQKKITEQCTDQMQPPVRAVLTLAELDGKVICAAEIPGLDVADRPCYYKGSGRVKGSYIRVGDADIVMTDLELYNFEAFRRHLHDDERPIAHAKMDMLDQDALAAYVLQKHRSKPGFARLTDAQTYEMLGLSREDVPTLAAVLNFGIYPQGLLPQLAITAIVVPGTEIGDTRDAARFLDNKRMEGTLPAMVEDALAFCSRNMKTRTIIDPSTGKRADRTEYPLTAIREAVLNALVHRDYSHFTEGTSIQIDFFTDRLEIHSPGCLYGRMTIDQLGVAKPDLRNPTLAVMAESLTNAENRYSGIPTIRREMASFGLPAPVFENRRDEFVVTLYNRTFVEEDCAETTPEIKPTDLPEFCAIPRSKQEIAEHLGIGVSDYLMKRYVMPLVRAGALRLTIPDKPRSRWQKYVRA